jgi:integrase/recombinase XerC
MSDLISIYLAHLLSLGRTDATLSTYAEMLRRLDRDLPYGVASTTTAELRDWVFAPGLARGTLALRRTIVAGFFTWATDPDDPYLDFNPAQRLPKVTVHARARRAPSDADLADLLGRSSGQHRLLFTLAAFAGLRCIEIAALDREHVTDESVWVQGKGSKERLIPAHPALWAAVRDLPPGPLLRHDDGERLTRRSVMRMGNQAMDKLGHPEITMHDWRRWFATKAYEASGRDLRVVQELLGHSSPAVTQRYVAVRSDRKVSAVAGLPDCGAQR